MVPPLRGSRRRGPCVVVWAGPGAVVAGPSGRLMEPLAGSLPESRLRVGLVQRGVPRPVAQHPVRLPNGRRARLDLAWPRPRPGHRPLALEYDGEEHRTITRHGLDLDREAGLDDLGWDVVRVTARQLGDLDALAARVRRELGC